MAARSKAWVSGRSRARIAVSNPATGMNVFSWKFCQVESLRQADHTSRGVLPSVACLNECDREVLITKRPWPTRGCCSVEKTKQQHHMTRIKYLFICSVVVKALNRMVPGSIPGGVTEDFFRGTPDRTTCPEVDSASESEYQGFLLE